MTKKESKIENLKVMISNCESKIERLEAQKRLYTLSLNRLLENENFPKEEMKNEG